MKKYYLIAIFLFFPSIVWALPNWTQTTIGQDYGIWSTLKNNLNEPPSFIFSKDSRFGVAIKDLSRFLSNSIFRSGDIVAQRFCFEKTGECVETFQQNYSNNNQINLKKDIPYTFQDFNFSQPYKNNSLPMYIKLTTNLLDSVGMENEQTTNWFSIAETLSFQASDPYPRQLWVNGSNNFNSITTHSIDRVDKDIVYPYSRDDNNWSLRGCYYTDLTLNKAHILTYNFDDCTGGKNVPGKYQITRIDYCNRRENLCGIIRAQYRLVPTSTLGWNRDYGEECARTTKYSEILSIANALGLGDSGLYSTRYFNFDRSTVNPKRCASGHFGASIQIRFVLQDHIGRKAQSLRSLVQKKNLYTKINSVGIMFLK